MAISLVAEIRTGTDGLTSAGGVPLRDQPGWLEALRFHTSPISENRERTEGFIDRAALYQTVKDRDLIRGKWAVARLWLDWTIEGNETEGLRDFCVTARAVDGGTDAILFPERDADIQRQDDYDDEDRRLGKHTVNLFGWKADGSVSTIRYEVEPRKYFKDGDAATETPKARRAAAITHLPHDPATIDLKYARLSLGDIGGDANEPARKLDINVKSAETFMSLGALERTLSLNGAMPMEMHQLSARSFSAIDAQLAAVDDPNLTYKAEEFAGETHNSVVIPAMSRAYRFLQQGGQGDE